MSILSPPREETVMKMNNSGRLRNFVIALAEVLAQPVAEVEILQQGAALLQELVAVDDWLPAEYAQPDLARYRQYLLHADSLQRFSVVSFVWGPGQQTPIHNHTVWGLIGILRGAEISQSYALENGLLRAQGQPLRLEPGAVTSVSPRLGDVHRVCNAYDDQVSISIHAYGANIGVVRRLVYHPDGTTSPFISGYSNQTLPKIRDLSSDPAAA